MKQYIVIEYQTGGCDYTIGCGYRITTFQAKNWKEAVNIVLTKEGEDYPGEYLMNEHNWKPEQRIVSWFRGESGASNVTLIEAAGSMDMDDLILEKIRETERTENEKAQKETEEQERKEFERLKQKFGDE